jgi:hypothetical protein
MIDQSPPAALASMGERVHANEAECSASAFQMIKYCHHDDVQELSLFHMTTNLTHDAYVRLVHMNSLSGGSMRSNTVSKDDILMAASSPSWLVVCSHTDTHGGD